MNDEHLEHKIRSLLHEIAAKTPIGDPATGSDSQNKLHPAATHRFVDVRRFRVLSVAGMAACLLVGLIIIAGRKSDTPVTMQAAPSDSQRTPSSDTASTEELQSTVDNATSTPPGTDFAPAQTEPSASTEPDPSSTVADPPAGVIDYVVQMGDSLISIAQQHGTTTEAIIAANGWAEGIYHFIRSGDVIKVPSTVPGA